MKRKLFVLSMDAMVREDVEYMLTKPNFSKIMKHRAEVQGVRTVYPASTYPAHTTLLTGCYPDKHGIFSNVPLHASTDSVTHWYLHKKYVWVEDLFAAAKRSGCTTASVYWPITGRNPNIDHTINEYFFYYPNEADRMEEIFEDMGADEAAMQAVRENKHRFPTRRRGLDLCDLFDDFIMGCTCSLIRNKQPDVLLAHNCIIDSYRHTYGSFGEHITRCLNQFDLWLGEVIDAMRDAGVYENTDFVILSDHGQRDYHHDVRLNVLLERGGFIDVAPDGSIYDYQAYAKSNGQSATVYLSNKANRKLYDKVLAYLNQLKDEGTWGIANVLTEEELATQFHQSGPYAFMVEAVDDTAFSSAWKGDAVVHLSATKAGHGYMPDKGPQPIFMAHGPSFKNDVSIPRCELADVAPTLAAVLGASLPEADGRCLQELLNR